MPMLMASAGSFSGYLLPAISQKPVEEPNVKTRRHFAK